MSGKGLGELRGKAPPGVLCDRRQEYGSWR